MQFLEFLHQSWNVTGDLSFEVRELICFGVQRDPQYNCRNFGTNPSKNYKQDPNFCFFKSKRVPKMQNFMLISVLLEKMLKNACKKSYEKNSQLKVHFLGFYLHIVLVFLCNFLVIFFAFFPTVLYSA